MAQAAASRRSGARPSKRPSATYRLMWQAIRSRKQVRCTYEGCYREVCPHILGYKKLGEPAAFVFQFGGESTSKLPHGGDWRCLSLAEITNVKLHDGRWYSGSRHSRSQTCIQFVDVDVNVPDTLTRPQPLAFGSPALRPPQRPDE